MEAKGNSAEGGGAAAYPQFDTAATNGGGGGGGGGGQPTFHDYLKANSNSNYQQQQAELASFLMHGNNTTATRSTPGSPATFAGGGLGFNSVCASPVLGPSLPQSPQAVAAFLGGAHTKAQQYAYDSTVNSAVQSATGSPTTYNTRRGLLNSMAGLNMAPLPPPAISEAMYADSVAQEFNVSSGLADTANMFSIGSSFAAPVIAGTHPSIPGLSVTDVSNSNPSVVVPAPSSVSRAGAGSSNPSLLAAHQAAIMSRQPQLSPNVGPDFLKRVEETKAKGLRIELDGIPSENAKSRVETQIKITLRLTTADGERATCWSHLALPELLVSREKFRHRFSKPSQPNGPGQMTHSGSDGAMPLSPQHVVHMEAKIICSSDPTRNVETCYGCIKREYKRSLRRKDARLRSTAPSTCTTPGQSRPGSPTFDAAGVNRAMTGIMDSDWDEARIELEKKRIIIFNCNDLLDFSKGEVVLPTRITCYCRHHGEKIGFYVCLTMRDYQGNELASYMSPPIMITDDHKSTKFKTDRSKSRTKPEYERHHGDGNAAYANHALAGFASPLHGGGSGGGGNLHMVDGSGSSLFNAQNRAAAAGRQAFSARNSPTLRPYSHHALLDTYSHFASLAGTPSLENTPLGSPMLSAAHISGFDSPFNLPQAAVYNQHQQVSGPATAAFFNSMASGSTYPSVTAAAVAAAVAGTTPAQQMNANSVTNSVYNSPAGMHMQQQSALPISPIYASMHQPHQQSIGGGTLSLQQTTAGLMDPGLFGSDNSGASAAAAAAAAVAAAGLMPQMGGAEDASRVSGQPMQINQLMPSQGPVAGGTTILISGRGFHPNIAVFFGETQACRVQVLSSSNITCVLPPFKSPAPVSVKITDLLTMSVYESIGPVSDAGVFTYMEDTDQAVLELALQVMGLRQGGQQSQQQQEQLGGPLMALGSPLMSPVMQTQGSPSSRKSSPSSQNIPAPGSGSDAQALSQQKQQMNRILHDPVIVTKLRALKKASEGRDLMGIENNLVGIFMVLQSKDLMDASRLSMHHETTGRTLLHFATLLGMRSLAEFLISRGVNIDDIENSGMTALHFAGMYAKRESIFELLLNSGASTVIRSGVGQTASDLAKASGFVHLQQVADERDGYMNFIRDENVAELGNNVQPNDGAMRQSLAEMMSQMSAAGSAAGGGAQQHSSGDNGMFDSSMFFGGPPPNQQFQ